MPEHDLIHLLELRKENLEIVEVQIDRLAVRGQAVGGSALPEGSRLISVMREGAAEIAARTELRPGDQVLAIVPTNSAADLRRALLGAPK